MDLYSDMFWTKTRVPSNFYAVNTSISLYALFFIWTDVFQPNTYTHTYDISKLLLTYKNKQTDIFLDKVCIQIT